MTSQVNPNNIDGTYPIAGQDNDSQGFRDNFTNIRNNLTYVKAEIEDLQNKAVFKSALTNTTLDNSLLGNAIVGASLTQWRETYNDIGTASGAITVDFTNGNFQKITLSGSATLTFSWPSNTSNQYSSIKLWIHVEDSSYTLSLPSTMTLGDPDSIAGLSGTNPPIITFSSAEISNNYDYLFEIFTVNAGTTLGIKDLIRNRDIDLSSLGVTGNLSLTGNLSVSGNVIGNLNLATSTTTTIPIKFGVGAAGGNVTVVQQGALEANLGVGATGTASNVMIFSPTNATSSGEGLVPVTHYALLGSNVAINNGTAPALTTSYSMFGGPVAAGAHIGNVMLAAGTTYEFDVHSMVSMAAAPTASTIGFTFGGNATTTYYSYEVQSYPVSGTGGLNQGNTSHWYGTTAFPATSAVVLNTQAYTNFAVRARGLVRINAQGTVLPLLQWNTAPTQIATAVQGSYMKFTPIGTQANIVIGTIMGTPFLP